MQKPRVLIEYEKSLAIAKKDLEEIKKMDAEGLVGSGCVARQEQLVYQLEHLLEEVEED